MQRWFTNLRNRSLLARSALLVAVVLVFYALVAPFAFSFGGWTGVCAAAAAAAFCLVGAVAALTACHVLRGPKYLLHGLLTGMALRMGTPLILGAALHLYGGPLSEAGLLYYLLAFYPLTLGVETVLSLPRDLKTASVSDASEGKPYQD